MLEVNRHELREFFDNDLLKAYRFVVKYGDTKISISSKQSKKMLITVLHKAEFEPKQIRHMTGASLYMSKKSNYKFTKSFISAVYALNDISLILKKANDYSAIPIPITKRIVERLIIEDLVLAGWSIKQIYLATGFSRSRIERKYKELT